MTPPTEGGDPDLPTDDRPFTDEEVEVILAAMFERDRGRIWGEWR